MLINMQAIAQQDNDKPFFRDVSSKYLDINMGVTNLSVRDFATSPLTYSGTLFNAGIGHLSFTRQREVEYGAKFGVGRGYYRNTEGVNVNNAASVYVLNAFYSRLYRINSISNSKWNFKVGGMADAMMDVRLNGAFQNAGYGYEMINTLFLSGKVTYMYERKSYDTTKVLFIKRVLRPRKVDVSYQLNVPFMNNALRNGYAYIGNESINTTPLFKEYDYLWFSGLRFTSELGYTNYMHNGNMWRASYLWHVLKTDDEFNRFEMAGHAFEFSLFFHLNKKPS